MMPVIFSEFRPFESLHSENGLLRISVNNGRQVIVLKETKVLIVGLDGGTFKKLKPWLANGDLPLLSKFFNGGCHANLRAFFPTLSPLEWACFYTGKAPSKLGLFALSHVEDLKDPLIPRQFIDSTAVHAKSLWKILNEQKIAVGVVNIPATYPVEQLDGFIISGYMTPPSALDYYHPKTLKNYLNGYRIDSEFEYMPDKPIRREEIFEELDSIADHRTNTVVEIMRSVKVRFLAINFKEIDVLQHIFWDDDSTLLKFMKRVDLMIGKLVDEIQPTHIFVMSDHGFHEAESEYFYVNEWLKQKNLLKPASSLTGRFWNVAYKIAIALSKRSQTIREFVMSHKESAAKYAGFQIDLNRSTVYASQWGMFFAPQARLDPKYEQTRKQLREELISLKSPSGYTVFDHVYLREELFQGEFHDRFPDLIPIPSPRFLINPNLYDKIFDVRIDRPYLKGAHKSDANGIFIVWGEGVREGVDLGTVSIIDITPTTLSLFGYKPPSDMDGRVIEEAFSSEFLAKITRQEVSIVISGEDDKDRKTYTEQEQEQIMDQLRRLGYV